MEVKVKQGNIVTAAADAIVVNLFQGDAKPVLGPGALTVDKATNGLIREHIKDHEFEGKELDTLVLHSPAGIKAKHVIVVGLGKKEEFSPVVSRKVAAKSIQKARELEAKTVVTVIHAGGTLETGLASQMTTEGLLLGNYQFDRYKTKDKEKREKQLIQSVALIEPEQAKFGLAKEGVKKGKAIAAAILNTRDIVNESPTKIKPVTLTHAASAIAELSENITITILDEKRLYREGYNTLLAVAAGSDEPPFLIHLHYKPRHAKGSTALVGKGVTFDSGGLGIKPWSAMMSMKSDMAGGATVLGIFQALAELEAIGQPVNMEVHGVIPATENMISGKAMRPDDIIETKSGKTIEIVHTDAEGRLILSDALTYATLLKPETIVDFATLTGAAIRALGRDYSVHMGNDERLLKLISQAATESGEISWPLPLPKQYHKYVESVVADLANASTSDSAPGAIIGGLFLQEFVDNTPWVHLDIAGPAWQEEDINPVYPKGATGYGILLGLTLLELISENRQQLLDR